MKAVEVSDPARCLFVGDRLFDDVWGAQNVGMRAAHIPHSAIPVEQVGHTEGTPDATVHRLSELPDLIDSWNKAAA
jgi:putative hydrolase of the HAD superfamily